MSGIDTLISEPGAAFDAEDDTEAAFEYCLERGWSDGLPVVLPTTERVERMLQYCDRDFEMLIAVRAVKRAASS